MATIERQRSAVVSQTASAELQVASAQRQRVSSRKQAELVPAWTVQLPVVMSAPAESAPAAFLDCPALSGKEADTLVESAAQRESLPPDLLRAVIKQESGFHPCAVSGAGAQGLMQLMPATAVDLHVNNPFDPRENVQAGASYLKQLVNRYGGDLRRALSAYNAGMGRVDFAGGTPDIYETQNYVGSITGQLGYDQLPMPGVNIPGVNLPESDLPPPVEPVNGTVRPVALHLTLGSVNFGNNGVTVNLNGDGPAAPKP